MIILSNSLDCQYFILLTSDHCYSFNLHIFHLWACMASISHLIDKVAYPMACLDFKS